MPFIALPQDIYKFPPPVGSPEYRGWMSSDLLFRDAQLLLEGEGGRQRLMREAHDKNAEFKRAARFTMLNSSDPTDLSLFLPVLLEEVGPWWETDDDLADRAVSFYPSQSWPILLAMASRGHIGATWAISQYEGLGQPTLVKLWKSSNPAVKANALRYLDDRTVIASAMNSQDVQVVNIAVSCQAAYKPDAMKKFLTDSRGLVRAAAAEQSDRWSDGSPKAMWQWIALSHDPVARVRAAAMLHLGPVGLKWANGPWTINAIRAVNRAIRFDEVSVRRNAILAARCWMLEWNEVRTGRWTPEEVNFAKQTFQLSAFRNSALWQLLHLTGNSLDTKGLQVVPPVRALAIAGDRRLVPVVLELVLKDSTNRFDLVDALEQIPGRDSQQALITIIKARLDEATRNNYPGSYDDVTLGSAVRGYQGQGANERPLIHLLRDQKYSAATRFMLATYLAPLARADLLKSIFLMLDDPKTGRDNRINLMYRLILNKNPLVKNELTKVAHEESDPDVRSAAEATLAQW